METGICKVKSETQPPPSGNLEACTGCGACAAICPKDSITMQPDDEGFLYPVTDAHVCTDCGLCRQTCPVNPKETFPNKRASAARGSKPLSVFASWHLDENIRRDSSSGGVFTALAESILAKGGAVVGAAFDDQFVVRHILIESSDDLHRLRSSKYVQSEVFQALYLQIRDQLKQGRPVLFSGTPCQVAGLRKFLLRDYNGLYCCDIVCHGVPSPRLFASYIQANLKSDNELKTVSFRDKSKGWRNFCVRLIWQHGEQYVIQSNQYLAMFLLNYALRPSCYECNFTNTSRPGDLTIGDFWGVAKKYPEYDRDDKGTSLVLVNTKKGKAWLADSHPSLFLGSADLDTAIASNPMLIHPCQRPSERETFYLDLKSLPFAAMVRKYRFHRLTRFRIFAGKAKRELKSVIRRLFCRDESGDRK